MFCKRTWSIEGISSIIFSYSESREVKDDHDNQILIIVGCSINRKPMTKGDSIL